MRLFRVYICKCKGFVGYIKRQVGRIDEVKSEEALGLNLKKSFFTFGFLLYYSVKPRCSNKGSIFGSLPLKLR